MKPWRPNKGATVAHLKTTNELAGEIGLSERSAHNRIAVARNITQEVKDVTRNTEIANSKNLHRRHLNETQRAVVGARIANMQRGVFHGNQYEVSANLQIPNISQPEAAKQLNISPRMIATVKEIERKAPELISQMERGEMTAHEAIKTIKKALRDTEGVKRAEVKSTTRLYHGNMLDVLNLLGTFDLVVADPPYNVTKWEWDKLGNRDQFLKETQGWLEAIVPHLNDKYNIFWFCSPSYAADIEILMRGMGLKINSRLVWHRRNMAKGSDAKYKFIDSWEMIFHIGNRELNFPSTWDDSRFDVQTFAVPQTNFQDTKYHPTQKPQELIKWLVTYGSFIGDKILDPFAGSGTTATTCDGREYALIEQDAEYIKIIEQRLGVKVEDVRL